MRDPVSVVAKTTGHDYDSFPDSSIIEFEFPETSEPGFFDDLAPDWEDWKGFDGWRSTWQSSPNSLARTAP